MLSAKDMSTSKTKAAIVGISGTTLTSDESDLLATLPPAGVILFSRNIADPPQLEQLVTQLRDRLPEAAVLMIDQEGGRVSRLRPPHWPGLPAPATLGALWRNDRYAARRAARAHGAALGVLAREAKIDIVTAPVLDVLAEGTNPVIGDRAISNDPVAVGVLGADIAWGVQFQGVQPVMKHIPGHGKATVDSHTALPRITASNLDADLAPFAANSGLPWAMTAHVVYEVWDKDLPATLSRRIIDDVIRRRIGFQGILISDDLAMDALTGDPATRARGALTAGCDLALYCPGDLPGNRAVLEACFTFDMTRLVSLKKNAPELSTNMLAVNA